MICATDSRMCAKRARIDNFFGVSTQPNCAIILVINLGSTWRTQTRRWLKTVLGDTLPQDAAQYLILHDRWLNNHFILSETPDYHVVMMSSAGVEFPVGLNERQAIINLHRTMLHESLLSGVLPVVVLGPNKLHDGTKERANTVWDAVIKEIDNDRQLRGIPIIDLRSVEAVNEYRFATGELERGARLLAQGYQELMTRIELCWTNKRQR